MSDADSDSDPFDPSDSPNDLSKPAKRSPKETASQVFLGTFLAGGSSAAAAVTVMAPFERVKLILQTQKSASHITKDKEFKGMTDCFKRVTREQGFFTLWRGNWAGVVRVFPYQALNFSFKELFKQGLPQTHTLLSRLGVNIISGGLAGCVSLTVIYPLDFARTRMALDIAKSRQYRGIFHIISTTINYSGVRALYRGYVFSIIGAFLYRAVYFGFYDTIMECVKTEYSKKLWVAFPVAEFSATSAGLLSYPLDTVRRRMMLQSFRPKHQKLVLPAPGSDPSKPVTYSGTMDCFRAIWRNEGLRGFYHGGLTNMIRGTGGALMLVLYDNIQFRLLHHNPHLAPVLASTRGLHHHPNSSEHEDAKLSLMDLQSKPCQIFKDSCLFCNF